MKHAYLVTGASTGIGYAISAALARSGHAVFAGIRSDRDAERLRELDQRVTPLRIDVTDATQIAAAMRTIAESGCALRGVVNNAGIAVAGPLEYLAMQDFRRQFDVNVFGSLAVTQAALPLLRETGGRIVFIGSVSGQIAPPFVGAYAASKFALEAMADALRLELRPFRISVSIVEPGNVRTPIWEKGRTEKDETIARMPAQAMLHYGEQIARLVAVSEREERTGIEPEIVAQAALHALTSRRPRARYPVGAPPLWQRTMARVVPDSLRDRLVQRALEKP